MSGIKLKRSTSVAQPYYFTVVAANGQTLVTSETYTTKAAAVNGMEALIGVMKVAKDYDDLT